MARVTERTGPAATVGVLLTAHGERRPGAGNEQVFRIARTLSDRGLEIAVGFISGMPTIKDALDALAARRILVYPLFASSGYFTRDRLVQILEEANADGRPIEMLTPLGLDPGLADPVVELARNAALTRAFPLDACTAILLAHGSRRNPASRRSTERIAQEIARRQVFRRIEIAFLEEHPSLEEAAASIAGPAVVVGLFSGEGLHGARDAPRLVARLGRTDVVFGGIMGSAPGIEDLIFRAVISAIGCRSPARSGADQ